MNCYGSSSTFTQDREDLSSGSSVKRKCSSDRAATALGGDHCHLTIRQQQPTLQILKGSALTHLNCFTTRTPNAPLHPYTTTFSSPTPPKPATSSFGELFGFLSSTHPKAKPRKGTKLWGDPEKRMPWAAFWTHKETVSGLKNILYAYHIQNELGVSLHFSRKK